MTNDAVAFLKAILAGQWDAAGVFADWLEERGDPRGVLLRRRWRRWQKEKPGAECVPREALARMRARCAELGGEAPSWLSAIVAAPLTDIADATFRVYLRNKFPNEYLDATPIDPNSQAYKDS